MERNGRVPAKTVQNPTKTNAFKSQRNSNPFVRIGLLLIPHKPGPPPTYSISIQNLFFGRCCYLNQLYNIFFMITILFLGFLNFSCFIREYTILTLLLTSPTEVGTLNARKNGFQGPARIRLFPSLPPPQIALTPNWWVWSRDLLLARTCGGQLAAPRGPVVKLITLVTRRGGKAPMGGQIDITLRFGTRFQCTLHRNTEKNKF